MNSLTLRGADLVVETLLAHGTRHLYALSGNHVMAIFDACVGKNINLIHTRHEAATVHMADAAGRLTGRAAIALVTGGPGHANAVSALYTARMAESPLVLLSGRSPVAQEGRGAFQEIDQAAMAAPVCKAAWSARDPRCLVADLKLALQIAETGRPGPVNLSLPSDLLESAAQTQIDTISEDARSAIAHLGELAAKVGVAATDRAVATLTTEALEWLAQAQRPLILAGPTGLNPILRNRLATLAQALGIPLIPMDSPRGADDPRLGRLASVMAEADKVLLLGKRMDFTLKFGAAPAFSSSCRFFQLDPEPDELHRARLNLGTRLERQAIADPAAAILAAEQWAARQRERPSLAETDWFQRVVQAIGWRPPEWAAIHDNEAQRLHPAQIGRVLAAVFAREPRAVLICDGGEIGQWIQACVDPQRRVINGPAGAIGVALPMALAARCVEPDAPVIAVSGDGAFGFHATEFDTAVRHDLPFVFVIGNDLRWNAEYQIQLRQYGDQRLFGCELIDTNYEQVAVALGGEGARVERESNLAARLDKAIDSGRPTCLNVLIQGLSAPVATKA